MSDSLWQPIGEFTVDTGTVMICDPCYAKEAIKGVFVNTEIGCGVIVKSSDGTYPVYARYENGVCAEVRIMFVEGEKPAP